MSLFLIAACGPALFIFTALLLGFITPSYSAIKQTVSELVLGRFGMGQTVNFAVSGLLIVILSLLLLNRGAAIAPTIGAFVMGSILVLSAFYRTDPVKGSIDKPTATRGMIHVLLFIVGVLAIVVTQLLFGIMAFGTALSFYALASAVIVAACLLLVLKYPKRQGIYQRVLISMIMFWITIFAYAYRK